MPHPRIHLVAITFVTFAFLGIGGCMQSESPDWFREAKFGMFVHWGPVSLQGTEIGWSRGGERRGRGGKGEVPVEIYDRLYEQFNPTGFDAREWVATAKQAGARYIVFTTKHHDGFCMFDSDLTDYKITRSPYGRDITAELARACHEAGLRLGFYYSPVDWYHPDYRTENHARYIAYMHGQLRELCTRYGKVSIIWFDGLGGTADDWDSEKMLAEIRALQPGVVINNRAGLPADYDTPEQVVGRLQTDRAWETCMTLGDQWAYKPNDNIKSLDECIGILVRTVGGDGNLLLNVGPEPTGRIEARQADRLREIGAWLKENGRSLYGTRAGPFPPGPWGMCTHRGRTVYLHVLRWNDSRLVLPAIDRHVRRASLMDGTNVPVRQTAEGVELLLPERSQWIIALRLDRPAAGAAVEPMVSGSLAMGAKAKASNYHWNDERVGPANAVDDDYSTCWVTNMGTRQAWLELDLGRAVHVGRAVLCEASDHVESFQIEYKNGENWTVLAAGTHLGPRREISFNPVTAQVIRLNILTASRGPEISEFQLFAP